MAISSLIDITVPMLKVIISFVTLVGAINLFQAVKEILISRYAISTHGDVVRSALNWVSPV